MTTTPQAFPGVPDNVEDRFAMCKRHVIDRFAGTPAGAEPFRHLFVENVFPEWFYRALHARAFHHKYHTELQARKQDSKQFVNKRFNLAESDDPEAELVKRLFADPDVRRTILGRFYADVDAALEMSDCIHLNEFEFVYSEPGWFQNIHIDIPAKFLSFVFYLPEGEVSEQEEAENATILYDRDMKPVHQAAYRANSVCIFAPHFYSYHGFSTTIDRTVMVMFYINAGLRDKWRDHKRTKPWRRRHLSFLKDCIREKLEACPLIEYQEKGLDLAKERRRCKINEREGRVRT